MAALDLCCCAWAFSSCGEWGPLFVAVHGLLIAVASLVAEHGLWSAGSVVGAGRLSSCGSQALECRLSSCGTRAQLFRSMWDLPGPGLESVSPALAGRFLNTVPPGKPPYIGFYLVVSFLRYEPPLRLWFPFLSVCSNPILKMFFQLQQRESRVL